MHADEPIRVAVLGTSIGCTLHVRALKAAGFEVTALVGQDRDKTAARAAHFDIAESLDSLDAALDTGVDAVVVATPPETHHEFVMQAIAAGKHVLCEKPFALDPAAAEEMRDAAHEANVAHMVTHEFRWFAANAAVRDLVRDGRIGDPIQITAIFDHSLCAPADGYVPAWWRVQPRGGGWLRNYNAHGIDLVRYTAGEFAAISGAVHAGRDRGMSADDSYAFSFALTSGAQGVMAGSCRAWNTFQSTRIIGSDATLDLHSMRVTLTDADGQQDVEPSAELVERLRGGGPVVAAPQDAPCEVPDTPYDRAHYSNHGFAEQVGLCSAFASWIRDRSFSHPEIATFDDGLAHVKVIDAVERSRASQRWIELAWRCL